MSSARLRGDIRAAKGRRTPRAGCASRLVDEVHRRPGLFESLFYAIAVGEPWVRLRAVDAAEKASAKRPDFLVSVQRELLVLIHDPQPAIRWHAMQMVPRLSLGAAERSRAFDDIESCLADESAIVRVFAIQALFDLSLDDPGLRDRALAAIERAVDGGPPSVRARARRLLDEEAR